LPLLARPSAERQRRFLSRETGGRRLNQAWLDLVALGAELPRPKLVRARRPAKARLQAVQTPTLVLLGERSRAHDIDKASHHSIPTDNADELNRRVSAFLTQA
jgi:hypothetical protein